MTSETGHPCLSQSGDISELMSKTDEVMSIREFFNRIWSKIDVFLNAIEQPCHSTKYLL